MFAHSTKPFGSIVRLNIFQDSVFQALQDYGISARPFTMENEYRVAFSDLLLAECAQL